MSAAQPSFDTDPALGIYPDPIAKLVRGENSRVWDDKGKEYIDFSGGVATLSLGHVHPKLTAALNRQASRIWHTSNIYANDVRSELYKSLCDRTFADRVYLCNSGAEANEAALKLARRRGLAIGPDKDKVVSFSGGFHGRIGFSLAASPNVDMGRIFGPPDGFVELPFNDIPAARKMIDRNVCAVIVEPVQGEGGVNMADTDFLVELRKICDECNALLIFDEIQSGVGRTGALYRYMEIDVVPDLLTSAKGLGGGFPVAAMMASEPVAQSLGVGEHGTTYGGNPMACAVALAVLEEVGQADFLERVRNSSKRFSEKLDGINSRQTCFDEIRISGLLIGCDFNKGKVADFLPIAAGHGVLVIKAGANAIRLAPPLVITDEEIDEGMERLEQALRSL